MLKQVNKILYPGCVRSRDSRYTAGIETKVSAKNSVNRAMGLEPKGAIRYTNAMLILILLYESYTRV